MRSLSEIENEFLAIAQSIQKRQSKTPLAELVIEARLNHFTRPDGEPDYQGRSMEFRRWYGELINELNLSAKERNQFLASMRYANGNVLREELSQGELEAAGLSPQSPKVRGKASYDKVAAPYNFLRKGRISSKTDLDSAAELLRRIIDMIPEDKIEEVMKNANNL